MERQTQDSDGGGSQLSKMEHSTHCEIACRSFIEMNPYYALDHPSLSTIHATIKLSNKVFQLCNYRGSES